MSPRDNPMYGLLLARRESVWDAGLLAVALFAALVGLATGPQVVSALFIVLFALVRSYREASRLSSLVQGRGIEEVLMARTGVHDLLDGMALYCLRATAVPGICFWLWLITLQVVGGNAPGALHTFVLWLPCLGVTVVSCCYLMQLAVTGMMGRRLVPTVLMTLWIGLLLALAVVTAAGQWLTPLGLGAALAGVAMLARRYTGAALLDRLTPPPSVIRTRSPYRPWWPSDDPITHREACREHHRGKAWLSWVVVTLATGLTWSLGPDTEFLFFVVLFPSVMVWTAYRTSPAVLQEREARTLDVMALTRLRSEAFVDGWAAHGWRPVAWRMAIPAAGLGYSIANMSSWSHVEEGVIMGCFAWALLTAAAQLGAYIGLWASVRAGTSRNGLSAALLVACIGSGVLLVITGVCVAALNSYATPVWPWCGSLLFGLMYRWDALAALTVDGGRSPGKLWHPLLPLLLLALPSQAPWAVIVAALTFPVLVHRQARQLPGLLVGCALLGSLFFLPGFQPRRPHGGQLTACKSNLKNIGTALEMYSTDYAGRYPTSSNLLTPDYLKTIPTCASVGSCTYVFQMASNPDQYTVVCSGGNHESAGITAPNYPQYTSVTGLIERP